jgi:hypothetical protein
VDKSNIVARSMRYIIFGLTLLMCINIRASAEEISDKSLCVDLEGKDNFYESDFVELIRNTLGQDIRRLAIVVGNNYKPKLVGDGERSSRYSVHKLANPSNDARGIAALLVSLEFKVVCALNVTAKSHVRLLLAVLTFQAEDKNGLTFYYFAGHGFADNLDSWVVGEGAEYDSLELLKMGSVSEKTIVSFLKSRGVPAIVIFDACREELYSASDIDKRQLGGKPLSIHHPMEKIPQVLVHYSTTERGYARDLSGQRNGLYAQVFLREVPKWPNMSVREVLDEKVGIGVLESPENPGQSQVPNLVSFPYKWSDVLLYDASSGPALDQAMGIVTFIEDSITRGPEAIAFACKSVLLFISEWITAPDEQVGSRFTVRMLIERLVRLKRQIENLHYQCNENTVTAGTPGSYTVPPIVHVNIKPVMLNSANATSESPVSTASGTWLATNTAVIGLNTPANSGQRTELSHLATGFTTSRIANTDNSHETILFAGISSTNAEIIDTKDQYVVKFRQDSAEIVDHGDTVDHIDKIKSDGNAKFVLIAPIGASVSQRRLQSLRVITTSMTMVYSGVKADQIILPSGEIRDAIQLFTLRDDEILIKKIADPGLQVYQLNGDNLRSDPKPEFARSLRYYKEQTQF